MGVYNGVELEDATVTGDRLLLRRWHADDAPAVLAALAHASMHEFLELPYPYTLDAAREFVTGVGHDGRREGTGLGCAVVVRATGEVVGAATLRLGWSPQIGYWTAPTARGRGYAAEAVRMLARFGFGELGLHRVGLECDVANTASVRTALAAGFTFEGVSRDAAPVTKRGGAQSEWGDAALFGRLATDDGLPIAPAFAFLPPEGLGDGVVTLRASQVSDVSGVLETMRDPVTVSWAFAPPDADLAELRRRTRRAGLDWLVGRVAEMSIIDVASGEFAGDISLRHGGPPQVGEFGYSVHPAFRGRGYAGRALRLATEWAFSTGWVHLRLGAKIGNIASQRTAEAAGFERTRVAPSILRNPDGTFSDEAQYELVRPH